MRPTRLFLPVAMVFVLALALRLLPHPIAPLDELYHAKRMTFSAAHFPHVLELDPDRGTRGAWCPWPPLYDLAAGGYARLLGATTLTEVTRRVALLPPLLFALFVALSTFLVVRARGLVAGVLCGVALAISPYLVDFSAVGSIDHHYLEPALAFAIAFAVILVLRDQSIASGLLLGLAMSAAMFIQTALLLACALAFVALFFARPHRQGVIAFGILTAAVALYAMTRPAGYPASAWFLGWPHAGIFAGATAALLLRSRRAPAWMALAAGAAVIVATPAAADAILGGSHFLGGDPWLRTISEFQPVITEAPIDLVSDVALLSGGLILVWPFAVRAWRRRDLTEGTIALFAITYLVLDLSSRRFRPLAIVFLALAGAIEASRIFTTSRRRSVAIAAMLLIVSPPAIQLLLWRSQPIADTHPSWFRAAAFFRSQTAGGRVLAPWSMGHLLDVVGGRPVIVDNFGSMPDAIDFARANDALLTKDERTLARYCDENAIRWVVFTEPLGGIAEAAAVNDLDQTRYVDGKQARPLARATCWWRAIHGGAALTRFRRVDAEGTSGRILERVR